MFISETKSTALLEGTTYQPAVSPDKIGIPQLAMATDATARPISMAAAELMDTKVKPIELAIFEIEALANEREKWEVNEHAASHSRLYSILHKCYQFYLRMTEPQVPADVRAHLHEGLKNFIESRGYTCKSNTHDMVRVVKAVFGIIDRRRVSAYSLALRSALVAGPVNAEGQPTPLPADCLVEWIEEQGGVEKARRFRSKQPLPIAVRASSVMATLSGQKLMSFATDAAVLQLEPTDANNMMVLIATYRPSGEFEVNAVLKNDKAINAALTAYGRSHQKSAPKA